MSMSISTAGDDEEKAISEINVTRWWT